MAFSSILSILLNSFLVVLASLLSLLVLLIPLDKYELSHPRNANITVFDSSQRLIIELFDSCA